MIKSRVNIPLLLLSFVILGAFAVLHLKNAAEAHAADTTYRTSYQYQNYYSPSMANAEITWGSFSPNPAYGAPGEPITITGVTFPEHTSVRIYFGSVYAGSVTTDGDGRFQTVVDVPNLPEGLVTMTATNSDPYNPPRFYVNPIETDSYYSDRYTPSYPSDRYSDSGTINDLKNQIDDLKDQLRSTQSHLNACLRR